MSQVACPPNLPAAFYPPIQYTTLDKQNLDKLRAIKDEAPFGRLRSGTPRSEIEYRLIVNKRRSALLAPDLKWQFWAGLGLGAAAAAVLVVKNRP